MTERRLSIQEELQQRRPFQSKREEVLDVYKRQGPTVCRGVRAYVDGCHLTAGTVVPDRAIMIKDKIIGYVEW